MAFNETVEVTTSVLRIQPFLGKPIEQMPVLLASQPRRIPLTILNIFEKRIAKGSDQKASQDSYFTSSDMFIVDPSGSDAMKAVWYEHEKAQELAKQMKSTDQLINWSFPVDADLYCEFTGEGVYDFKPSTVRALRIDGYSCSKEREAFWEFAVRGKKAVFDDNLKFQTDRERTIENSMGVFPSTYKGMRLVWVGSVGVNSDASGYYFLDGNGGRLAGELAPEVLQQVTAPQAQRETAPQVTLEQTLDADAVASIREGKPFVYKGRIYAYIPDVELKQ